MFVFAILSLALVPLCRSCQDIDPSACILMAQKQPSLCSDDAVALTACPRYCKLCPVECYHCNATLQDYHMCNTTTPCQKGQMCMLKELKSVVDGHHEYEMTCADKLQCDNPWSAVSVFGKRDVEKRDVSVKCCSEDLCNYPEAMTQPPTTETTTTTFVPSFTHGLGCIRDVIIVVDESTSMSRHEVDIKQFLTNVVSQLPVSASEVHVALGLFADSSRTAFHLNDYTQKSSLLSALNHVSFHGGTGDTNEGLAYLVTQASSSSNRANAPDVVIFITDDTVTDKVELNRLEAQVQNSFHNVISVEIGHINYGHLATDTQHDFNLASVRDLNRIERQVVALIC